jgi:magnesium chelatase subunit D
MRPQCFPFSAVVGMDDLRLALILNAVSPAVGGVLVRGEKGTAKSTMVRALAAVLPPVQVVPGCRFSCDPAAPDAGCPDNPHERAAPPLARPARLVELPVGASEDRLVGAMDIERVLTDGITAYEPGLLARAHRGVLYVDEVNLLPDHLVDLLLDAAALGTCYVEREGVSVAHPARFLLVGTMNPEEGELRPQLLDRFGLTVEAAAPQDAGMRAEAVRRRLAYDSDPAAFTAAWAEEESALADRIAEARRRLPAVVLPEAALRQVASVCAALGVDGLRADLVTARAAIAHAAWAGRGEVSGEDIRAAARLALPHRRRRQPFDAPGISEGELDRVLAETAGSGDDRPGGGPGGDPDGPGGGPGGRDHAIAGHPGTGRASTGELAGGASEQGTGGDGAGRGAAAPGPLFRVRRLGVPGTGDGTPGRRSRARAGSGRVTGARLPRGRITRLHLPATIAAAAPRQAVRGRAVQPGQAAGGSGLPGQAVGRARKRPDHRAGEGTGQAGRQPLRLRRSDLREARLEGRESNLILFAVDASGSMAARSRMSAVKGAILSLLIDAYQRRDKAGLVAFRGAGAEVLLPPTFSVEAAAARLAALPTGGRTPLAAGLLRAHEVLRAERIRDPRRRALLVVVTDGRATGGPTAAADARRAAARLAADGVTSVVVDCETGPLRLGLAAGLAGALRGTLLQPGDLAAGPLADSVRFLKGAA